MSSGKARRHIHKYYRIQLGFGKVWACAHPECNHYMPQAMEAMVNGKRSICWGCGEAFDLNPLNMKDDQPVCDECRLGREVIEKIQDQTSPSPFKF